jgi:hypothetical protein
MIPFSGKWLIHTNKNEECWICGKHKFALFFWSPLQIARTQISDDLKLNKALLIEKA